MDDMQWERYCYIMDPFDKDARMSEVREDFKELTKEMYAYAQKQPEEVQDMIFSYMSTFLSVNLRLFILACQNLRLPNEAIE